MESFESTTKESKVLSKPQLSNRSKGSNIIMTPKKTSSITITGNYFKTIAKAFKQNEQKPLNRAQANQRSMSVKCCMLKGAVESLLGSTELITDVRSKTDVEDFEDDIFIAESDNFEECEAVRNKSMQNLFSLHSNNNWY